MQHSFFRRTVTATSISSGSNPNLAHIFVVIKPVSIAPRIRQTWALTALFLWKRNTSPSSITGGDVCEIRDELLA